MLASETRRSVGRPREFDEESVLEAAMDVFWQKGYEATSLADLCEATGLHKGSLYQAFGDKHQLFMQALSHYSEKEFQSVMAIVSDSKSPLENIKTVVYAVANMADEAHGCLIINSMVELAPHDEEVRAAVHSFAERRLKAMIKMIGAAQKTGEIRSELDAMMLARQLLMTLAGAAAVVKGVLKSNEIIGVLDTMIDSWT